MGTPDGIRVALTKAIEHLSAHREEARYTDGAAIATLVDGLRCEAKDPDGRAVYSDMPASVGGEDSAPSPGWLLRAAVASCDATLIAMHAAAAGITLSQLQVTIDSTSDDLGILGIDPSVPAGPLTMRARVRIGSPDASFEQLRALVAEAIQHCPVSDAVARPVPVSLEVQVL